MKLKWVNKMGKKITVCTPTYNRGELLKYLFDSLSKQNFDSFEWIIVDDGSCDNTETIVKQFVLNATFPVIYLKKKNGGKHTALNLGIEYATGILCWIVDSDDYVTENSLNFIWESWNDIEDKNQYAGISGLKSYPDGKIIGNSTSEFFIDTDCLSYRYKYRIQGDKSEVYRTDILKKFPFPEFQNERFMTEALVWNRIANDGYKLRWTNEVIYICEYLDGGLTNTSDKNIVESWRGTTLYYKELLSYKQIPLKDKILNGARAYLHYCYEKGIGFKGIFAITHNLVYIFLSWVIYNAKLLKRSLVRG